jgi:hypothetical protein
VGRSASRWYADNLANRGLWCNVWNRRQYPNPWSNGTLQPQGNENRHGGDPNATRWDNGDTHTLTNAGDDANYATDTLAL